MTARFERRVRAAFGAFVGHDRYPCLAARGLQSRGDYELGVYGPLGSAPATERLAADLAGFCLRAGAPGAGDPMTAFVGVFTGRVPRGECAFERRLWIQLQRLHDRDPATSWAASVSADPDDPRFSFSFGGAALFVIGLHPASSRLARRFAWPALVFNPHAQFDRLRRDGRFNRLREAIRERDLALQGTINPSLADFGERSEARQYSGRDARGSDWRCPFHQRKP
jgi:FPC/CPF motif-containing protein YcgG